MFLSCPLWIFITYFYDITNRGCTFQAPTILTKIKMEGRSTGNAITMSFMRTGNWETLAAPEGRSSAQTRSRSESTSWKLGVKRPQSLLEVKGEVRVRSLQT